MSYNFPMSYCNWGTTSKENLLYHDTEWGIPVHDDQKQFEFLMLEVMQCGLNWQIIIHKRPIFRKCFNNFDYDKIAQYDIQDINRIMLTPGMIKSPRKIKAIIHNAQCFQKIRKEFGSFCAYLWHFSDGKTILYHNHQEGYIPVSNGLSDQISRDLKKRGFKFLGSITIYSHLQACGMINDHDKNCPRFQYILDHFPCVQKECFLEKDVHCFRDK